MIDIQSCRVVEASAHPSHPRDPGKWRGSGPASAAAELRPATSVATPSYAFRQPPFTAAERRWISDFRRAGVPVTTVAWALDRTVEEIAVRFRILGGGDAGLRPAPKAGATADAPRRVPPEEPALPVRPARPSPLAEAERVFRARLEVRDNAYLLDGRTVTLRELVLEAASRGTTIPYPGVCPLPESFHSGPSAAPSGPAQRPCPRRAAKG